MRIRLLLLLFLAVTRAWAEPAPAGFVLVKGGTFRNPKSNYHGRPVTVADFYLAKYEVTQREWTAVMGANPSRFRGDDRPVETVSWYDCIEYCNRRSRREGLQPCYTLDRTRRDPANDNDADDLKWTVTINAGANGYRLPTEVEWEYAASGGALSRGFTYSGGDVVDQVAWYWQNSGDTYLSGTWHWQVIERNGNQTKPVGGKAPNELGLYDLSGNVREWCWDWLGGRAAATSGPLELAPGAVRVWRGGGWLGGDFCCAVAFRGGFEPNGSGADHGLRVCRGRQGEDTP